MNDYKPEEDEFDVQNLYDKSDGKFAHKFIERLDESFRERRLQLEAEPDNKVYQIDEPFEELQGTLNDFYRDEELCNESTLITGEDMCKLLDICLFLAEQTNIQKTAFHDTALELRRECKKLQE